MNIKKLISNNGIKSSMTEIYDPYENEIAERVNEILKQEFDIVKNIVDIGLKKTIQIKKVEQ